MSATSVTNCSNVATWPDDRFEEVRNCLWCGTVAAEPLIECVEDWFFGAVPGEFSFGQCCGCSSLVLLKRPRPAHVGAAYAGYYTHGEPEAVPQLGFVQTIGRGLAQCYANRRFAGSTALKDALGSAAFAPFRMRRREMDAVFRHLPGTPSQVLDYGCGNGDFLVRAAHLGHQVVGVDFDAEAVAFAVQRGLSVYEPATMPLAWFERRFDHITAAHVVEHVVDPIALLGDFHRWLKPGGHLFLEFPNAQAAGLAVHGRFWRGLEAPRHFSLPSEAGLRLALGEAGFAMVFVGHRIFARQFMDTQSCSAALAQGHVAGQARLPGPFSGPEMITCLARAL